jgi:hypothetical protein
MSNERFALAQRIAASAVELDEPPGFPCYVRSLTVNYMHAMARELAGDREGEIYDLTEDEA